MGGALAGGALAVGEALAVGGASDGTDGVRSRRMTDDDDEDDDDDDVVDDSGSDGISSSPEMTLLARVSHAPPMGHVNDLSYYSQT